MKAYGFPIIDYGNRNIYGQVFREDGEFLGQWISSDIWFLESDLRKHAKDCEYVFVTECPNFLLSDVITFNKSVGNIS